MPAPKRPRRNFSGKHPSRPIQAYSPKTIERVKYLLANTGLLPQEIAKLEGLSTRGVHDLDYRYGERTPELTEELIQQWNRKKSEQIEEARMKSKKAGLPKEVKDKIISENFALFPAAIKKFLIDPEEFCNRNNISFEDLVQDFAIHCWKQLDKFDPKKAKFSTFVYGVARRFVAKKTIALATGNNREANARIERAEGLGSPVARRRNQLLPRGYATIAEPVLKLWMDLGLRPELAVRFGEEETQTTLSYLVKETPGLTAFQRRVMELLIEGKTRQEIAKSLYPPNKPMIQSMKTISNIRNRAISGIKRFILEQRRK